MQVFQVRNEQHAKDVVSGELLRSEAGAVGTEATAGQGGLASGHVVGE